MGIELRVAVPDPSALLRGAERFGEELCQGLALWLRVSPMRMRTLYLRESPPLPPAPGGAQAPGEAPTIAAGLLLVDTEAASSPKARWDEGGDGLPPTAVEAIR